MFFVCAVLTLLTASFNVILSILIENSINISLGYEGGNIYWNIVFMIIAVLLYFVFLFIKMHLQVLLSEKKKIKLRKDIVKNALHSSRNNQTSVEIAHINKLIFYDSKIVSNRDKDVVFKFIEIVFGVFGGLIYLYSSNFYIGLIATVLLLIFYCFSDQYNKVIKKLDAEAIKIGESVSRLFHEIIEASEIIKVYQGNGFFSEKFYKVEDEKKENAICLDYKKNMLKAFTVLGIMALQITTILIACFLLDVSENAGMIVGIINVLIGSIFYPLTDIQNVIVGKNEYYNSLRRVEAFVDADYSDILQDDPIEIKKITFDNVRFRYDQNVSIAYENFEFKKNEIVGIYGESGTGKTTIAKLILNKLKPEKGEIKVTDIYDRVLDLNGNMKVSYLSSNNNLLQTSVINNIRMGNKAISQDEVANALKKLDLIDKINKCPLGLNACIGLDIDFSEGEKRRYHPYRMCIRKKKTGL